MPEHLIRLRGPWELLGGTGAHSEPARIDLPADRLPRSDRPLVLRRRFGRPARLPPGTSCRIRADDVPGLLRIILNGERIEGVPGDGASLPDAVSTATVPPLRSRNVLELTIAPGPPRSGAGGRPWGMVALVFGHADEPAG